MRPVFLAIHYFDAVRCGIIAAAIVTIGCGNPTTNPVNPLATKLPATEGSVRQPETLVVSEVDLDDDELVVGVSVGDHHRAYLVEALATPPGSVENASGHIVNDLLGSAPISVIYDAASNLCRVLTNSDNRPIDLQIRGVREGQLEFSFQGLPFLLSDPQLPLQDHPFVLTKWGAWKKDHPETDIYLGLLDQE